MATDMPVTIPGVTLRPMRTADIPAGLALCRESHWNQTAGEWALFLELTPDGAIVAERDGVVVGTAVTLPYAPSVAWVAMVLVDPASRGRGIGRTLLVRAMSNAPEGYALGLDATPAGRVLYLTLGFEDEFGLARWRRHHAAAAVVPATVRPIEPADWAGIAALDRRVFGADRRPVLEWCWRQAPGYAWVRYGQEGVEGFAFGRHGHDTEHVGPVVAASEVAARDLVTACLSRAPRPAVSIDAPDAQPGFLAWLRTQGFEVSRPFTRMRRGRLGEPGLPAHVFAATGPEFG